MAWWLQYGRPCHFEAVLASRKVQVTELYSLAQAWGNVAAVVIELPRFSRSRGVQLDKLRVAAPELFLEYPVPPLRLLACHYTKLPDYVAIKDLLRLAHVESFTTYGAIPLEQFAELPARLMWEHTGRCPCGKRSYLFAQCPGCLRQDAQEVELLRLEQAAEYEEPASDVVVAVPSAAVTLPSVLPQPPLRRGYETKSV